MRTRSLQRPNRSEGPGVFAQRNQGLEEHKVPPAYSRAEEYALLHLDPAYQGLVHHRRELNHVLAAGIRVHCELLDDGLVLGARSRKDVEGSQYLRAVNAHIKVSPTAAAQEHFCKWPAYCVTLRPPQSP